MYKQSCTFNDLAKETMQQALLSHYRKPTSEVVKPSVQTSSVQTPSVRTPSMQTPVQDTALPISSKPKQNIFQRIMSIKK